ncbi:regulator of G-protein signaling loco isoform X2 [Drosophila busckii]|uniref:regulator of G-protein signaling loco isoform X2 n=1 Tax=Drosophila busckii TaxID=30019 RepID=UPI00083EB526|nr:regulator of G-protein signaling loco isoform X2 [Drosophila busckii]
MSNGSTNKLKNNKLNVERSESICNMVERFVQSLGQLNDSGSCFDASFEIKHILQSPSLLATPRLRGRDRCLTELDREQLTRFVAEFEARQQQRGASTPKSKCRSPFVCRKAKELYGSVSGRRSASPQICVQPTLLELEEQPMRRCAEAEDLMPPPMALARVQAERRSCRSAARVLQFFRRRGSHKLSEPELNTSRCSSPVLLRHPAPLETERASVSASEDEDEPDDGISSASSNLTTQSNGYSSSSQSSNSRNISPDSSFEMHAPLLPRFKMTPPRAVCKASKDFARFLRGSFHAKRASITTLRRSLSDPDGVQQLDFSKLPTVHVVRNRALPANASPFRRAWGQSSFRTPRSDKLATAQQMPDKADGTSPRVRRTASMTSADNNDVYTKSFPSDELKSAKQTKATQPQPLALFHVPHIFTTPAPPSSVMATAATAAHAEDVEVTGPSSWGNSFERMLQDAAGMQTFAEFLKKEFSAENIYFWTACERYRQQESEPERIALAREIYSKHLANSSSDPVNVDSQARNLGDEKLNSGATDIFAPAQKQIFNLMKFDSYQRFIRSELYKSCVDAEQKRQPLPYTGADLDELLKTNFHIVASPKLKKSASNAEDRRRKSLLPWHRKTRSKSRDRSEVMADLQQGMLQAPQGTSQPLLALLGGPCSVQNSLSDLHSSRSSLSSFDAAPAASAESACNLCRVILTDGATTIVQTRPGETVAQLVERLLEKRNLVYPYYDVVFQGSTKSIDTQQSAQLLAGKEVLIERRVVFKLDLPDPKVISVKSKPKKQLHEVIRPILHKYNYQMECVHVLLRETQTPLDLMQPVTVADGQRLQISLRQPTKPQSRSLIEAAAAQGHLDELTNKVFNELLQSKADAAACHKPSDVCSMKSNELRSESSSSLLERMRRQQQQQQQRDNSNIPGSKLPKLKKKSTSSEHSEETATAAASMDPKKPIIAKLKAGVKLQSTERVAEHQDELLEGLKRAQLARLEDQRGTEINFDLPDFLKNKENLNAAASKLRKVRANLSPVSKASSPSADAAAPQAAPRLSITRSQSSSVSPMKVDVEQETELPMSMSMVSPTIKAQDLQEIAKAPPPLPPKPKVLPIKPSNWGAAATTSITGNYSNRFSPVKPATTPTASAAAAISPTAASATASGSFVTKLPKSLEQTGSRCAYLDEPSSSFV